MIINTFKNLYFVSVNVVNLFAPYFTHLKLSKPCPQQPVNSLSCASQLLMLSFFRNTFVDILFATCVCAYARL